MTDNMTVWNNMSKPPERALKKIYGGRLKGMTDINPQWRYEAMTEQFGQCGVGWKYKVERVWLEPCPDGQVIAFAEVKVYTKAEDKWSDAVPGIGGSMLIVQEKSGMHVSDEAYKMAITDALSVALKVLGVASAIYAGLWDGSKYLDELPQKIKNDTDPVPEAPQADTPKVMVTKQAQWLFGLGEKAKDPFSKGEVKQIIDWYTKKNGRTYEAGEYMIANFEMVCDDFLEWHQEQQAFGGQVEEEKQDDIDI